MHTNPKVSVLVKLAWIVSHRDTILAAMIRQKMFSDDSDLEVILNDPEVLEWYDRMAAMGHVPERRGVPAIHDAVLALAIEDELKSDPVIAETTQGRIYNNRRVGYQTFATQSKNHEAVDVASYAEATSVEEAMQKCLQEFAGDEYFNHGVKDIETQVVTMAAYKTVLDLD